MRPENLRTIYSADPSFFKTRQGSKPRCICSPSTRAQATLPHTRHVYPFLAPQHQAPARKLAHWWLCSPGHTAQNARRAVSNHGVKSCMSATLSKRKTHIHLAMTHPRLQRPSATLCQKSPKNPATAQERLSRKPIRQPGQTSAGFIVKQAMTNPPPTSWRHWVRDSNGWGCATPQANPQANQQVRYTASNTHMQKRYMQGHSGTGGLSGSSPHVKSLLSFSQSCTVAKATASDTALYANGQETSNTPIDTQATPCSTQPKGPQSTQELRQTTRPTQAPPNIPQHVA